MTTLILIGTLFLGGYEAQAHQTNHNHRARAPQTQIKIHWVWIKGHWSHGSWIKGYWSRQSRHNLDSHQHDSRWIPGRYEGRGPSRHWVPGRWVHR